MTIWCDPPRWVRSERLTCHLFADDPAALAQFAADLGLPPQACNLCAPIPHWVLDEDQRREAIERGAVSVSLSERDRLLPRLSRIGVEENRVRRAEGSRPARPGKSVKPPAQPGLLDSLGNGA